MIENKPNRLKSMAMMKCPNCHQGNMYINRSIFPLKQLMNMPERCPVCNQKYEIEIGFWYGTGYVSYAISVGTIFILAILYALTVGFSYKNNSIYFFIVLMISALIILQPWIMRYSRVLYLYVFVKYGRGQTLKSE
jgi:uncharacterized protein (DUF983 family)